MVTAARPAAWRVPAAVAAAIAAAFTVALVVVRPVPRLALHAVGIDGGLDLKGGVVIVYRIDPRTDPELVRDLSYQTGGTLDGDLLTLEYPGTPADQMGELVAALTRGTVRFQAVDNDDPTMRRLFARAESDPRAAALGIKASVDHWRSDSGGEAQNDYYLHATDRDALQTYLDELAAEGLRPAEDRELGFERIDPSNPDEATWWRTYYLERAVELDGSRIASATVSWDPQTDRPIVRLTFDDAGARAFADLTTRLVGKKLATVFGDRVNSAPIIMQPIRGGQTWITMGGFDPAAQEREAAALAASLGVGPLPPGEVVDARYVPPTVSPTTVWLARALCGLAIGALAFVLIGLVARRTTPAPAVTAVGSRDPTGRLVVSLAVLAAVYVSMSIEMPGVNDVELGAVVARGGGHGAWSFGAFMLGLTPVFTSFILVELAALAVPSWRRLRLTPDGRRKLARPIAAVAIVLAAVQGWALAAYLESLSFYGAEVVMHPGLASRALITLTLVGGTMVLVVVAALAGEYGLGNGYSTVIAAGFAIEVIALIEAAPRDPGPRVVWVLAAFLVAGIAIAIRWLVTRRAAADPPAAGDPAAPIALPVAGLVPMIWTTALFGLIPLLAQAHIVVPATWIDQLSPTTPVGRIAMLAVAVTLTAGFGWLWSRPRPPANALARMTGAAVVPSMRAWWWAVAGSAVVVVGVYAASLAIAEVTLATDGQAPPGPLLDVLAIAVATAIGLDLAAEWTARRGADLVAVWPIHQVGMTEVALRVLARAGITAHLRGRHHRALLQFFGPFVPIEVMVPADRAGEASALLRDLFDPAARGVTTAW